MGRPTESEMGTTEPSVARRRCSSSYRNLRFFSTFGSDCGGFLKNFLQKIRKTAETQLSPSCIQMSLLQRRRFAEETMRLNNTWIVRTPEN